MNFFEVADISKGFGGLMALNKVDFTVNEGEIVGLIGANGAGKTTLFNVVSGYYRPTTGTVWFKGEDITGMKPPQICKRGMVRTFQVVRPFRNMSVLRNVMVGKLFGRDRILIQKEAEREALSVLEFVGLWEKRDVMAEELTLVEHKRLEVARALACNPHLLLLDEVLAGLTATEMTQAMEIVSQIRHKLKVTILMVEHVMKAVVGLCDRVVVLHYGSKIAEGTPQEITEHPDVMEAYLGGKLEA
jgi:branched-chain amino acid transport system ATP-binding protein